MKRLYCYGSALVTVSLLLAGGASSAHAALPAFLPPQQEAPDITYVTGGIGDEERQAMRTVRGNYRLHLTSAAAQSGAFVGDTQLTIYNQQGEQLLSRTIDPLFYANLPQGTYTLVARSAGEERRKTITVGSRPVDVRFYW